MAQLLHQGSSAYKSSWRPCVPPVLLLVVLLLHAPAVLYCTSVALPPAPAVDNSRLPVTQQGPTAVAGAYGRLAGSRAADSVILVADVTVTKVQGATEALVTISTGVSGYRPGHVTTATAQEKEELQAFQEHLADDDPLDRKFESVSRALQPPRVLHSPKIQQQQQQQQQPLQRRSTVTGSEAPNSDTVSLLPSSSSGNPSTDAQSVQGSFRHSHDEVIGFQGPDWHCIKKPGCKPSSTPYGAAGDSSSNLEFFPMLPGGSGECEYFGGCDDVKAQGMCRASWMWEVDVMSGAVVQYCGEQCACPGESQ